MIFTVDHLKESGIPADCYTVAIDMLNELPRQYNQRLLWHGKDGKADIKNLKVGDLKNRKKKLEKALESINNALDADENPPVIIEGNERLTPPPVIGAHDELKLGKTALEAAIGKYNCGLENIGSGNIPAVPPKKWLARQLFELIYCCTGKKPNYGEQLVWCRLRVKDIAGESIGHSLIERLLDIYQPTKSSQSKQIS